jgi:hypothetical protein
MTTPLTAVKMRLQISRYRKQHKITNDFFWDPCDKDSRARLAFKFSKDSA